MEPVATNVNWTLVVAVLAVVISGIALVVSVLSFRRSGARVRVKMGPGFVAARDGSGQREDCLIVEAKNRGMARAHVKGLSLDVEGEHSIFVTRFHAGEIPAVIDGYDEKHWAIEVGKMPFQGTANRIAKVRVRLNMGGLRSRKSEWIQIELNYDKRAD